MDNRRTSFADSGTSDPARSFDSNVGQAYADSKLINASLPASTRGFNMLAMSADGTDSRHKGKLGARPTSVVASSF